jgi:hypothetical protein
VLLSPTYRVSHDLFVLPTRLFSARGRAQPRLHVRLDKRHAPTPYCPRRELSPEPNPRPKTRTTPADVAERGVASIGVHSLENLCVEEEYV